MISVASADGNIRPGFEKLLARICEGSVGIVLSVEASRQARTGLPGTRSTHVRSIGSLARSGTHRMPQTFNHDPVERPDDRRRPDDTRQRAPYDRDRIRDARATRASHFATRIAWGLAGLAAIGLAGLGGFLLSTLGHG